jgi:hypothetical protein
MEANIQPYTAIGANIQPYDFLWFSYDNEDEACGRPPAHICPHCGEGFYLHEALARHVKDTHKTKAAVRGRIAPGSFRKKTTANTLPLPASEAEAGTSQPKTAPSKKRLKLSAKSFVPESASSLSLRANPPAGLFHERQEETLCAMHALNNAIGLRWQERDDMENACTDYLRDAHREGLPEIRDDHASPGGWYSSEVLAYAVISTSMKQLGRQEYEMSLQPLQHNPELIDHCVGAVVNQAN